MNLLDPPSGFTAVSTFVVLAVVGIIFVLREAMR